MKAIHIQSEEPGSPLVWLETDDPEFPLDEVLVDIHATSLNRADLQQRAGHYPPPPGASEILGLDMAGRIAEVGPDVTGWQAGDRVCALLASGGYAERVAVNQRMLMPIPPDWGYEQAAAVPEVFLTAYLNIFVEASFQPGEVGLMHGGAGGVGTAAIQLVREADGHMIVTAGTAEKTAQCRELGAELAINYKEEDFVKRTLAHTGGAGVDVLVDIVGAPYLERNIRLLKIGGRLVHLATLGGSRAEIDIRTLMGRRLRLIGSVLRPRSLDEKVEIKERFMARFWPLLEEGIIEPVIDSVFPIEAANEAHERMAANQNTGKIILKVR
jgi:putative PIG3 family NAD(P)H quinone oxidoreductase